MLCLYWQRLQISLDFPWVQAKGEGPECTISTILFGLFFLSGGNFLSLPFFCQTFISLPTTLTGTPLDIHDNNLKYILPYGITHKYIEGFNNTVCKNRVILTIDFCILAFSERLTFIAPVHSY